MNSRLRCACLLVVGLSLSAVANLWGQSDPDPKGVVAKVSGDNLTYADLQRSEGGKLLQAKYQYYLNERKALEELIDNQLLADEAKRRNISLDQLLNAEVYKDVKDPTEDQLEVYYEGLDTQEPYASVRDEVLQHIRELRRAKARAAFVDNLRKQANINILLTPPVADVDIAKAYAKGSPDAQVTLVEFADYECPYCQKVNPQIQQMKKEYGDKLTIVYKDFPLPMHHTSEKAAEAARCAGEQGKFWEYHDVLFYSKQTDVAALKEHAQVLRLDTDRFDACLDNGTEAAAVKKDLEEAKGLGLTGTPSFFVNGHFFSGVVDLGTLKDMVNQQLNLAATTHAKQQVSQK
ncbi:thioredoxin domain-containing protein [Alloacidobacterium dinghuense]|uniref:Thioredoxin domain-containing protein n=1 Tax=Alloacidobacterium dinghuense TaxID=2763107 RepID=A0A7G8BEE4_9BACT|nr:thioredoxin domain-containing protein [Alloacidobacterium dinghuense]QNI30914.1 thioredoxin domain-containing protein [Alloacidobacterium dinghuense]